MSIFHCQAQFLSSVGLRELKTKENLNSGEWVNAELIWKFKRGFSEGGRKLIRPLTRVFVKRAYTVFGLDAWCTINLTLLLYYNVYS